MKPNMEKSTENDKNNNSNTEISEFLSSTFHYEACVERRRGEKSF